jgi:hypothetical protein
VAVSRQTIAHYVVTCDAEVNAACSVTHPETPHRCPASLTALSWEALADVLEVSRWRTVKRDGEERHYCPSHRDDHS